MNWSALAAGTAAVMLISVVWLLLGSIICCEIRTYP